jgi:hypothetical protein
MRYHGFNPKFVVDAELSINLRGVKEYHLFSHDYGDTVASELIARDLENTRRPKLLSVAFLNGGLFPETHHRIFFQSFLLSPIGPWCR